MGNQGAISSSRRSPVLRSFHCDVVAMDMLQIALPSGV